jgi:hypothetical protein
MQSSAWPVARIFCNIAVILLKDEIGTASGFATSLVEGRTFFEIVRN